MLAARRSANVAVTAFYHQARQNSALTGINAMPVLENTINRHTVGQPLKGCVILCIQHTLATMLPVIEGFKKMGAEAIFAMGKSYSENPETAQALEGMEAVHYRRQSRQAAISQFMPTFQRETSLLWEQVENFTKENSAVCKILVLDHGGYATQIAPNTDIPITIVEKTTIGIERGAYLPFPRVEMATSAAKRFLESPAVASAVTRKLHSTGLLPEILTPGLHCSVIGYGAVGAALTENLTRLGHQVMVYDIDPRKTTNLPTGAKAVRDFVPAMAYSDIIFGCTGKDITKGNLELFDLTPQPKTLVSCSSDDVEFLELLRQIQRNRGKKPSNPLESIVSDTRGGSRIKILRGGFPVNFDNTPESVSAMYIQLTRSLLIAAAAQAAKICSSVDTPFACMLDPAEQLVISRDFLTFLKAIEPTYPSLTEFDNLFKQADNDCLNWLRKHSGGQAPTAPLGMEPVPELK